MQIGDGQYFCGGAVAISKHTQLTTIIMSGDTVVRVGYKTILRAKQAENFLVCTPTCDILGYISVSNKCVRGKKAVWG